MYIDLKAMYFILSLLGIVVLIYLILTLNNINKLVKNANEVVLDNKNNIKKSVAKLPDVVSNMGVVSENAKDVTEVVTEITADLIVKKESMKSNVEVATDILNIVKSVFGK